MERTLGSTADPDASIHGPVGPVTEGPPGTSCAMGLRERLAEVRPDRRSITRRRCLLSARRELDAGEALAASRFLLEFVAHGHVADSGEASRCCHALRDCLWSTFVRVPEGPASDRIRRRYRAVCLAVSGVARQLDQPFLTMLGSFRLGAFGKSSELAESEVDPLESLPGPERDVPSLLERLRRQPGDADALLGLAVLGPLRWQEPWESAAAFRRRVCVEEGLYVAGILQGAHELERSAAPVAVLETLAPLAHLALATSRASAPRTHPDPLRSTLAAPPRRPSDLPRESLVGSRRTHPVRRSLATSRPASSPGLAAPPPPSAPPARDDTTGVGELLDQVAAAVETEPLDAAARNLRQLVERTGTFGDPFSSAVEGGVRTLLWKALLPEPAAHRRDRVLEHLLALTHSMGFAGLIPICERILVGAIPAGERADRLALLLEQSPRSSELLHAASQLSSGTEGDDVEVRHREAAGEMYLRERDLFRASRMFKAVLVDSPASRAAQVGLTRVMALGVEQVEAAVRFRSIRVWGACGDPPEEALAACKDFLARHRFYTPALEELARLLERCGRHGESVAVYLVLAQRALHRDEFSEARAHLRKILEHDFENDDALLLLASLEAAPEGAPCEAWRFRVWLLEREGLLRAAIHHAHQQLTGEPADLPALGILADLSRKAGEDPRPHLYRKGFLAWKTGDLRMAQDCFEEAIRESHDPEGRIMERLVSRESTT